MRAIRVHRPGGPEVLQIDAMPVPAPRAGWARIRVRAFGLNRSELYTRQGYSPSVCFPRVLGIECVGTVDDAGGVPRERVLPVHTSLPWDVLAALPETWLTAWGSVIEALEVRAVRPRGIVCHTGSSATRGCWSASILRRQ